MCRDCLIVVRPERGRICLESGSYHLTSLPCPVCGSKDHLHNTNKLVEEDQDDNDESSSSGGGDYTETVTYQHVCPLCSHVIASHYYSFSVTHEHKNNHVSLFTKQEYLMDCALCGAGADVSTVLNDIKDTETDNQQHEQHRVVLSSSSSNPFVHSSVILSFSAAASFVISEDKSPVGNEDEWA